MGKKQTRKSKGAETITNKLFQIAKQKPNDTFKRKLAKYTYIISELDYGEKRSVNDLDDSDYENFEKLLFHMAEQYGISNLEDWCKVEQPGDLYRIREEGQIHFYEETRSFFMTLHRRDHGEARNAYAGMKGIPASSSQLNQKELRMHEIYTYIKNELFGKKIPNPKEKEVKKNIFSDLDVVALHQKQEELQQRLKQNDHDLAQSKQDATVCAEAEWRQESILTELLELYAELLSPSLPEDVRQHYQTECCTYRKKLEALKAKRYHLYSNPEMLHIKLNLLEGTPEEQFAQIDPTQEKQNRIYSQCLKEFDRRAAALLDSIIEEVTQAVTKELDKEAEQQAFE